MKKKLMTALTSVCLLLALAIPVHASITDTGFSDVASDAWYAEAVAYCRDNGLLSGTTVTTFSPDMETSRAMLVTILYRQAGSPTVSQASDYTDVPSGAWYADALAWASAQGIVSGYSDGRFCPNDSITREQFVTILWRGESSPAPSHTGIPFTDQSAISAYAIDAVAWAQENGIISGGDDGRFSPHETANRAQTAVMLYRWLNTRDGGEGSAAPLPTPGDEPTNPDDGGIDLNLKMNVQIGNYTFTATLEDNAAVRELMDMMREGPVTIRMSDYSGFEKVGSLGRSLTTSNSQTTTSAGDIVLYNGNNIVMFYGSNSWSYTRIGKIEDLTNWTAALGHGDITAIFTLAE